MKRLPLILNVLAVAALSASCAYWALQLYKPAQRPIAALPPASRAAPDVASAGALFGGAQLAAVASNYQLTGTVAAGSESVAIIVADGNPPKAVRIGRELVPGVIVQEVYPRYVMLSEGGVAKRVDLAQDARPSSEMQAPVAAAQAVQEATGAQPQSSTPQSTMPGNQQVTVPPQTAGNPPAFVEVPGTTTSAPGALAPPQSQGKQPQAYVPPPAFMQQNQAQGQPPVRMPPPVPATGVRSEPPTR